MTDGFSLKSCLSSREKCKFVQTRFYGDYSLNILMDFIKIIILIYFSGATAVVDSYFEASNLQLVAGNFACLGNEEQLTSCTYSSASCGHHNEAGVRCPESCDIAGSLRLVGGDDAYDGRVESCQNGVWSSICQDSWSLEDATVVCRQLGYSILSKLFK